MHKRIIVMLACALCHLSITLKSQCSINKITQVFSPIQIVNNDTITVSRTGATDSMFFYCAPVTSPFFVGYNGQTGSGTGAFTFTFKPPVDSITLNFSGISEDSLDAEEIRLFVNGTHYAIPSAGSYNTCDSLAVLTAAGNIIACTNCLTSGWMGTTVPGPITSISILDTVLRGTPQGALFSIYFCNYSTDIISHNQYQKAKIYPNPANDEINIASPTEAIMYEITDLFGQTIKMNSLKENSKRIDISTLVKGAYFIHLYLNGSVSVAKFIKE